MKTPTLKQSSVADLAQLYLQVLAGRLDDEMGEAIGNEFARRCHNGRTLLLDLSVALSPNAQFTCFRFSRGEYELGNLIAGKFVPVKLDDAADGTDVCLPAPEPLVN